MGAGNSLSISDDSRMIALRTLIRLGLRAIRANQGSLLLADDKNQTLKFHFVISRNVLNQNSGLFETLIGQQIPFGSGITGLAASMRRPRFSVRENYDDFYAIRGDRSPHSVLAVPIISKDKLFGVMTAVSFDPDRAFDEDSADSYSEYAEVAAGLLS